MQDICRACLVKYDKKYINFDDVTLEYYNLFTSLNVNKAELPQTLCQNCWDSVHTFKDFRKKCISSEEYLRKMCEYDELRTNIDLKAEIKTEEPETCINNDSNDNIDYGYSESDDQHIESCPTPEPRRKKKAAVKFEPEEKKIENCAILDLRSIKKKDIKVSVEDQCIKSCAIPKPTTKKKIKVKRLTRPKLAVKKINTKDLCLDQINHRNQMVIDELVIEEDKDKPIKIEQDTLEVDVEDQRIESCAIPKSRRKKKMNVKGLTRPKLARKKIKTEDFCLDQTNHRNQMVIDELVIDKDKDKPIKIEQDTLEDSKEKGKQLTTSNEVLSISENDLHCGLCKESFQNGNQFSSHLESHRNKLFCIICHKSFPDWALFISHRLNHVPIKSRTCHLCWKIYRVDTYMEYHFRTEHLGEKGVKCKVCLKTYNSPRNMMRHARSMHCTTKKNHECHFCSKQYTSPYQLKLHLTSHSAEKKFSCDSCSFTCKRRTNLQAHKLRRHLIKKFKCGSCKRLFRKKEAMDKHKCAFRVCPKCGKVFLNHYFNKHLRSHSEEEVYTCDKCDAKYRTKNALKVHIDRHDGIRRMHCEYCPAKFYSFSVLIKHRRTHTGEKPYVCKICSRGFTGSHNLKVHMKVHGQILVRKKQRD